MAHRSPVALAAVLKASGWPIELLGEGVAIGLCESGDGRTYCDDEAEGDVDLQDNVWGPSYGAMQCRTLKADTGRGTARDIERLRRGLAEQCKSAREIYASQGLHAWSVTHAPATAYRAALPIGREAARDDSVLAVNVGDDITLDIGGSGPTLPDPGAIIGGAVDTLDPFARIEALLNYYGAVAEALLDPNTWRRLGLLLGGGLVALIGAAVVAAGFGRELPLPGALGKVAKLAGA